MSGMYQSRWQALRKLWLPSILGLACWAVILWIVYL